MNKRETTIFSCEYCGKEFEKEGTCQEHEKTCIFKNGDKDIQLAISKIIQYCNDRVCSNCKYAFGNDNKCFFATGCPCDWAQDK